MISRDVKSMKFCDTSSFSIEDRKYVRNSGKFFFSHIIPFSLHFALTDQPSICQADFSNTVSYLRGHRCVLFSEL